MPVPSRRPGGGVATEKGREKTVEKGKKRKKGGWRGLHCENHGEKGGGLAGLKLLVY